MIKFNIIISIFTFFNFLYFSISLPIAPYITPCRRNDPNFDECAIESAKKAIPEIVKGDPVYNIPKMNPMFLESITFPPISNLILSLQNVTVRGLEKVTPKRIHFNLTSRDVSIELFVPELDIQGHYNLKGQLLIFQIQGNGQSHIVYVNGTYVYKFHYEFFEKRHVTYINTTKHSLDLEVEYASFHFENLFNGNKLLSDQISSFIKENWREVNKDFSPFVANAIDSISYYTSNSVLGKVPYDNIFLV